MTYPVMLQFACKLKSKFLSYIKLVISQQNVSLLIPKKKKSLKLRAIAVLVTSGLEATMGSYVTNNGYNPTYGLYPSHPLLVSCFTNYCSLIKQKNHKLGLGAVLCLTDDKEEEAPSKEDPTPSDASSSTLYSPLHSLSLSPQRTQQKLLKIPFKRPTIKPKIFHSHSAGILNSALSSSRTSSRNGHKGSRSTFRAMEATPRMKFDDPTGAQAEEEQLEGDSRSSIKKPTHGEIIDAKSVCQFKFTSSQRKTSN
ncbi:hypothetical protein PSHT_08003 [Puccinia striiformis]|uniref:Uncharacterized protein n=1 Tax=Puccinia striiformis TaxID=27350 RepID=A0A2S4VTB0_9BASI|nr:hypothetical protein PSHT_08003 [Puccinia striiformis]